MSIAGKDDCIDHVGSVGENGLAPWPFYVAKGRTHSGKVSTLDVFTWVSQIGDLKDGQSSSVYGTHVHETVLT